MSLIFLGIFFLSIFILIFILIFKIKKKCYEERLEDWTVLDLLDLEQLEHNNSNIILNRFMGTFKRK